jgi:hypothetical protein
VDAGKNEISARQQAYRGSFPIPAAITCGESSSGFAAASDDLDAKGD